MQEPFFRPLGYGSAPLLVWAAHFFFAYAAVAAGCGTPWQPFLRPGLLAISALALAAIGWLLCGERGRKGLHRLLFATRIGNGLLAGVGVAWTTLPLLMLPVCGVG